MQHKNKIGLLLVAMAGLASAQTASLRNPPPGPLPGEIPSGIVPRQCQGFMYKGPQADNALLSCYLNDASNQMIAGTISWSFNNQWTPWQQWPAWAKSDLVQQFTN